MADPRDGARRARAGGEAEDVGRDLRRGHRTRDALLALRHRKVPPTINLDDRDPAVDMEIATEVRELPSGDLAALNNSFGFGGHNVAVAFKTV